jgi:hypothetical protein
MLHTYAALRLSKPQRLTDVKLCAVSVDQRLDRNLDMATLFFSEVFGNETAPRVMSGIIALSIFGNIVIMTFTASRGRGKSVSCLARSQIG